MSELATSKIIVLQAINAIANGMHVTSLKVGLHRDAADLVDSGFLKLSGGKLKLTDAGRAALAEGGSK